MPKFLDVPTWYGSSGTELQLWKTAGTKGQALCSNGAGAAPTWDVKLWETNGTKGQVLCSSGTDAAPIWSVNGFKYYALKASYTGSTSDYYWLYNINGGTPISGQQALVGEYCVIAGVSETENVTASVTKGCVGLITAMSSGWYRVTKTSYLAYCSMYFYHHVTLYVAQMSSVPINITFGYLSKSNIKSTTISSLASSLSSNFTAVTSSAVPKNCVLAYGQSSFFDSGPNSVIAVGAKNSSALYLVNSEYSTV